MLQTLLPALLILLFSVAAAAPASTLEDPKIPEDTQIITLPSGLQYSALATGGTDESPKKGDKVLVHYTGWTTEGKVFDSSRLRGAPAEFAVGQLIAGWNEALVLMHPGDRWKLTIPAALAYGERGAPPRIPANATLIFDMELIEVTVRSLPFVPFMNTPESKDLKSGSRYQPLVQGSGEEPASSFDYAKIDWAIHTEDGELLFNAAMLGQDLSGKVSGIPFSFFQEALGIMKPGGSCNLKVPKSAGQEWLSKLRITKEYEHTIWQLHCKSARSYPKPEFILPPQEELTSTPSGLKYKILRQGEGKKPSGPQSRVTVHYCGWLTSGTQFDSSYDRGDPISFGLSQVIAGWTEGMQLIGEGGALILVIPSDLGYGDRGSPPTIPGGATLVFYVETLAISD